jgi:hypothetical protein
MWLFTKAKSVPEFRIYFPTEAEMTRGQRRFYRHLRKELSKGRHPDVDGQISYLFAYTYEILARWREKGFESIHDHLQDLGEAYHHEEKFSSGCKRWSLDCLLARRMYDQFLERGALSSPFGTVTHESNLRLNVQHHIGAVADPVDLFRMASGRATKIAKQHPGLFRDALCEVIETKANENGPWLDRILREIGNKVGGYEYGMFQGAPIVRNPKLEFKLFAYYTASDCLAEIKAAGKDAENVVREKLGLPKIGEGWIAETELFHNLEKSFPETLIIQHGRPAWLGRQHFDVWFPRWNIAVEYHGEQHFKPVEFFGGEEAFRANQERDQRKSRLASRHVVKLFVATAETDYNELVESIGKAHAEKRRPQVEL